MDKNQHFRNLDDVISYVKRMSAMMGIDEIIIADNNLDNNIPLGTTFVFPKGAVTIDPKWIPEFEIDENGKLKLVNGVKIVLLIPELIFRVTDENIVCASKNRYSVFMGDEKNEQ